MLELEHNCIHGIDLADRCFNCEELIPASILPKTIPVTKLSYEDWKKRSEFNNCFFTECNMCEQAYKQYLNN